MTAVVVPVVVPRAVVLAVAAAPHQPAVVIPVQPMPVPQAHPVSLQTARADAETVLLLQAELARLRTRLSAAS